MNGHWRYDDARKAVHARADGRCEAMLIGCTVQMTCTHHVEGRRVPDAHHPDRLLGLCNDCHLRIHERPEWAREHGFMRSRLGQVTPPAWHRKDTT